MWATNLQAPKPARIRVYMLINLGLSYQILESIGYIAFRS